MKLFLIEHDPCQLRQLLRLVKTHPNCGDASCFFMLKEAAAAMTAEAPELVIVEWSGRDGWPEYLAAAAKLVRTPLLAVISADSDCRNEAPVADAMAFILKPYLDEHILAILDKADRALDGE